jgi:hypothetical protein
MGKEEVTPASARLCCESFREALVVVLQHCETLVSVVSGIHIDNDKAARLARSDPDIRVWPVPPPLLDLLTVGRGFA